MWLKNYSPTQDSCASSIGIIESLPFNCGITTALNPNIRPVFIVPKLAMKAAMTCRNAFPRSALSGCISTIGLVAPFGSVLITVGVGIVLTRNRESSLKFEC